MQDIFAIDKVTNQGKILSLDDEKSEVGAYDITAISIAHYPTVASIYDLTASGASLGDGYGPKVVSKNEANMDDLISSGAVFAVPGERTSALALLRIVAGTRAVKFLLE